MRSYTEITHLGESQLQLGSTVSNRMEADSAYGAAIMRGLEVLGAAAYTYVSEGSGFPQLIERLEAFFDEAGAEELWHRYWFTAYCPGTASIGGPHPNTRIESVKIDYTAWGGGDFDATDAFVTPESPAIIKAWDTNIPEGDVHKHRVIYVVDLPRLEVGDYAFSFATVDKKDWPGKDRAIESLVHLHMSPVEAPIDRVRAKVYAESSSLCALFGHSQLGSELANSTDFVRHFEHASSRNGRELSLLIGSTIEKLGEMWLKEGDPSSYPIWSQIFATLSKSLAEQVNFGGTGADSLDFFTHWNWAHDKCQGGAHEVVLSDLIDKHRYALLNQLALASKGHPEQGLIDEAKYADGYESLAKRRLASGGKDSERHTIQVESELPSFEEMRQMSLEEPKL
jgi:hypothetical protein